jgi:hypothetical protein
MHAGATYACYDEHVAPGHWAGYMSSGGAGAKTGEVNPTRWH